MNDRPNSVAASGRRYFGPACRASQVLKNIKGVAATSAFIDHITRSRKRLSDAQRPHPLSPLQALAAGRHDTAPRSALLKRGIHQQPSSSIDVSFSMPGSWNRPSSSTPHAATDRHDQLLNGRILPRQGKLTFVQAAKISAIGSSVM